MQTKNLLVAVAAAAFGFGAGVAIQHAHITPIGDSHALPVQSQVVANGRSLPDFSSLVDVAGPAVVNVSVVQKIRTSGAPQGIDPSNPLFGLIPFQAPAPRVPAQGVGSGFIVSPDGYILTNAHVVADASEVTVKLTDQREFKAKVIGADRRTDVALIKIDGKGLPTVKVGNSEQTKVGEWVAAIGSPFGFDNSVTAGIVSAKARSLPDDNYVPFLQTDVAINPGNSGGPLLNVNGEVIGINSQIYSRTGGYMGVSFAIPIEVAMKVKDDLQKFGKVNRGRLGVVVQPISRELADSFGIKDAQGALVNSVEPDSAAAKAGVAAGDVIVSVNDHAISQPADLVRAIGNTAPGQTVKLKIFHNGSARELNAKLGEVAPEKTAAAEVAEPGQSSGKVGLSVRPLTSGEQKQLATSGGLVVEGVAGAAAAAGIAPGDVILAINNEQITSVNQLRRAIEQHKGNVAVLVQRDEQRLYIPMKVS